MNPFWEIKILLTETNPTVINMVEKTLEKSHVFYFLRRIENIHDLNFELKYNKPDLIISGSQMSGFGAIEVLDQAHLYASDIPVLVLSAAHNAGAEKELVNHGAYDIIYHSDVNRLPKEAAFICEQKNMKIA